MIYTEDRETFERDLFNKPPHCARLAVHIGTYTCKLSPSDAEQFVKRAVDNLWDNRGKIKTAPDILRLWIAACDSVAKSRPTWMVWVNGEWVKVRAAKLRYL